MLESVQVHELLSPQQGVSRLQVNKLGGEGIQIELPSDQPLTQNMDP